MSANARQDFAERMMALHGDLEQRFFAHQKALLHRDFARAAEAIAEYRARLLDHIQDEEEFALPRYAAAGGDKTDAPTKLFLGEHEKMRAFIAECDDRTQALIRDPDDRRLLELFDREATYKNLVLHHDLRERNHLYPFMAKKLTAEEQEQVLAALRWSGA
jgi:hemerythrin-like domain-containing protein